MPPGPPPGKGQRPPPTAATNNRRPAPSNPTGPLAPTNRASAPNQQQEDTEGTTTVNNAPPPAQTDAPSSSSAPRRRVGPRGGGRGRGAHRNSGSNTYQTAHERRREKHRESRRQRGIPLDDSGSSTPDTTTDDEPIPDPENPPEPVTDEELSREYGNIGRLRCCAVLVVIITFLAMGAFGASIYFPSVFKISEGTGAIDRSFGLIFECRRPDDCGEYDFGRDFFFETCVRSGQEFSDRLRLVQGIVGIGIVMAFASFIFSIVVVCHIGRLRALFVSVFLTLTSGLITGAGSIFTLITFSEWLFCGQSFCQVTTSRPCYAEEDLSMYLMFGGVGGLLLAAVMTLFMRLHIYAHQVRNRTEREELAEELRRRREARRQRRLALGKTATKQKRVRRTKEAPPPPEPEYGDDEMETYVVQDRSLYVEREAEDQRQEEEHPELVEVEEFNEPEPQPEEEEGPEPSSTLAPSASRSVFQRSYFDGQMQWEFDDESGYYYCYESGLFWDPATHQYYDPRTESWSIDVPEDLATVDYGYGNNDNTADDNDAPQEEAVEEEPFDEYDNAPPPPASPLRQGGGAHELTLIPQSGFQTKEDRSYQEPPYPELQPRRSRHSSSSHYYQRYRHDDDDEDSYLSEEEFAGDARYHQQRRPYQ